MTSTGPPAIVSDAWSRVYDARVGRLATSGTSAAPDVVPCCFAIDELVAYSAVDDKPKRTQRLARLDAVDRTGWATLLVDSYQEDWQRLWWIRVRGPAAVVEDGEQHDRAVRLLLAKYPQYRTHRLEGPIILLRLLHWRTWAALRG
jgi:PPOX class probable F420-dependent enzyme